MSDSEGYSKTMVHKIIFDAVIHALQVGAPGIAETGRNAIAVNAALRAAAQIDVLTADFIASLGTGREATAQ